jgi:hypothetical protein
MSGRCGTEIHIVEAQITVMRRPRARPMPVDLPYWSISVSWGAPAKPCVHGDYNLTHWRPNLEWPSRLLTFSTSMSVKR